jgi:polyketide biosynthesis enoyl-CoA hydratase PksH
MTGKAPIRRVSIDRGDGRNTIDDALVDRLHRELDLAQADPVCRVVVLTSAPGVFCTGMNLAAAGRSGGANGSEAGGAFFDLLRRFTEVPLIVVAAVDGQVAGGGVGLVAACDLVYATESSSFALPEALWGLLPCCVLPFLIRRVGFQRAYAMTLTTQPVDAQEAFGSGLVDAVAPDPAVPVRRLAFRAGKLDPATVEDAKRYATRLCDISEETRALAVGELGRLMALPEVRARLAAFAQHQRFPWEAAG